MKKTSISNANNLRDLLKICRKIPSPRENPYHLVVCPPKVTKLKTWKRPIDAYKRWEFRKNISKESRLRGKFMAKIRNSDSFGSCIPTFLIWYAPPCRAKFYIYRGDVSPLRGEKPIFGPLSKTIPMAALRAGLPVQRRQCISTMFHLLSCLYIGQNIQLRNWTVE